MTYHKGQGLTRVELGLTQERPASQPFEPCTKGAKLPRTLALEEEMVEHLMSQSYGEEDEQE